MEELYIDMRGFDSEDEGLRQQIVKKFHSTFGLNQYVVQKITIKLLHEKSEHGDAYVRCSVQANVINQPIVCTQIRSQNTITAITLAIEHANLKLSHRINGSKEVQKRVQQKKDVQHYS
jgi:hypothetical protein